MSEYAPLHSLLDAKSSPHPLLDTATLNHIHLKVRDFDRSQRFYEKYFGWQPRVQIPSSVRGMRMLVDKAGFMLILERNDDPKEMPSWFHLGFQMLSKEAVRTLARYFEQEDVKVLDPLLEEETYSSFTIEDPDGYHLEIFWEAAR
jgi:catechol-2,3-dioxygenase